MKCYISTFYQYENYGTRLQNYALSVALRKLGVEPVTLALNVMREKWSCLIKNVCSYLPAISNRQKIWKCNREKRQAFQFFYEKINICQKKHKELFKLDFSDAIAIAGSDQIWSPMHLKKRKHEAELYFLRFAPSSKRFAYAPSFGVKEVPGEMRTMYSRYISEFERLSVREDMGQNIIYDLLGERVPVLPDPVFLLDKEEWNKEIDKVNAVKLNEKYIVVYFLGDHGEQIWEKIRAAAKQWNAKILHIAGNSFDKGVIVPSPEEFVQLIRSAQAVFTDSFHGSAFSIIMQTPFLVFPRKDVDQFSRMETLLRKYRCQDAIADDIEDYSEVFRHDVAFTEKIAKSEKIRGISYLEQIIRSYTKRLEG